MYKRFISFFMMICFCITCCSCADDDSSDNVVGVVAEYIENSINLSENYDFEYTTIDLLSNYEYSGIAHMCGNIISLEGIYITDKYCSDSDTFLALPLCNKVGFSTVSGKVTYLDNYIPIVIVVSTIGQGVQLHTNECAHRLCDDYSEYKINYYICNIDSGEVYIPNETVTNTMDYILNDAEYIISYEEAVALGITEKANNYSVVRRTNSNVNNSTNNTDNSSNIGDNDYE